MAKKAEVMKIPSISELIVVEQLPVIKERLRSITAAIDERLSVVDGLVCSEDTLNSVRKVRADFRKEFDELEELRKAVKKAVLDPYSQFEAVYKECVTDKYNAADTILKGKVTVVERDIRARKLEQVKAYFDEYAAAQGVSAYADFDRQASGSIQNSLTMNKCMAICRERIDSLASGLRAVNAQPDGIKAEVLAEFKKTLDATAAITTVLERHKAIEEAKETQKEHEHGETETAERVAKVEAALAPPKVIEPDDDPMMKVTFTVTAKKSKLIELKQYLTDGGYEYE